MPREESENMYQKLIAIAYKLKIMSRKESSSNTTFRLSQIFHPIETKFKRKISILEQL
jgi:hypothetical protein